MIRVTEIWEGASKRLMRLSFIGMSGTGKSHWSSRLVEQGYKRFCCDDLIEQRLQPELTTSGGTTISMGEWMGFPYEAHYPEREAKYLGYEVEILTEILNHIEANPKHNRNIIIDTTGSVIYMETDLLERLQRLTTIVYLDTPLAVQERMRSAYCTNPAPVVWRDKFNQQPNETHEAALARCYPDLLASRTHEYKKWADITLDYHLLRQPAFVVDDFLNEISNVYTVVEKAL